MARKSRAEMGISLDIRDSYEYTFNKSMSSTDSYRVLWSKAMLKESAGHKTRNIY